MEQLEFTVAPGQEGQRLDAFLAKSQQQLSRSAVQGLLEQGLVLNNGREANKKDKTRWGMRW